MKHFGRVVMCILIGALVVPATRAQVFQGTGYLHFRDGDVVEFETLTPEDVYGSRGSFRTTDSLSVSRTEAGSVIDLDWALITEVVFLGPAQWIGERVHVTLRNGQEAEFYNRSRITRFRYDYFDTFAQTAQSDLVSSQRIARVVFGDDFGDAKINPETGQIWPGSYRFDPYTGRRLQWIDSSSSSFRVHEGQGISVSQEYNFVATDVRVPGFSSEALSRALPSAGQNTRSDRTNNSSLEKAVIDYSTTFMNPFASSEEVSESLRQLRDLVFE